MPASLGIFRIYKKYIIIYFLLLILIPFILYGISRIEKIDVRNNDPQYTVTYTQTKEFSETLNQMGLWERNKVSLGENMYMTVKKLTITFIDTPRPELYQKDADGRILWSSGTRIENKTNLVIFIYLSPTLLDNPTYNTGRNIDKLITNIVLQDVYEVTNTEREYPRIFPSSLVKMFSENDIYNPFHISHEQ